VPEIVFHPLPVGEIPCDPEDLGSGAVPVFQRHEVHVDPTFLPAEPDPCFPAEQFTGPEYPREVSGLALFQSGREKIFSFPPDDLVVRETERL
jgi:hypothetical protein